MFKFKTLVSKIVLILLLIAVIILPSIGYAADKYIVKFVYFKTKIAPEVNHQKYDKMVKDFQEFFKKEMVRHGFGDKTFKIETDETGDLKIHSINAKHPANHYTGEIFNAYFHKICEELPLHLNPKKNANEQHNAYIVILGGIPIVGDGLGSPDGSGFTWNGNIAGGVSLANEKYELRHPHHYTSLIAHELAHAFILKHNFWNGSLMGPLPFGGPSFITDYEAQILNVHPLFNDVHIINPPPEVIGDLHLKAKGQHKVIFKVRVKGHADLYCIMLVRGMNCIGTANLEGRDTFAEIEVPRLYLEEFSGFRVYVFDVNGNRGFKGYDEIPIPEPEKTGGNGIFDVKNPDLGIDDDKEEDQEVTEVDEKDDENEQEPRNVTPKSKLTTSWAKMKARY